MKLTKILIFTLVIFLITAYFGGIVLSEEVSEFEKKVVSLDFEEIELKDALRLISINTGANIVIDPDVKGKVTARFEKPLPLLKALSFILSPHGYEYRVEDGVIRIKKSPQQFLTKT
ncbi:hypothetical protein H5U35_09325, partial [Candidatus Aerophobetes bacterium]|nr:hypothetical protein [Candidatus Aerophobetes bacterium]